MENITRNPTGSNSGFFKVIAGFALAVSGLLGAGGILYNLLAPGGWLARVFDRSLAEGLAAVLALFIVGVCIRLTAREVLHPA